MPHDRSHTAPPGPQDDAPRAPQRQPLGQHERILQQFIESAPIALAMFDRDMRYLAYSRRYLVDYRLPDADITGQSHYDVFPELPPRWREVHDRCQAGAVESAENDEFVREDGTVDWVHWRIEPWRDPSGDIGGVILFSEVVTERKRAEDELRTSHEMIENLTAMVPGVVYQYRLYPDGRSCFPFASRGMQDIYEYSPEEVREDATPVFGRLHPEDHDRVAAAIRRSAEELTPFHCEFRVILPRQGLRWRLSDAVPQRMEDGGTMWYGIISDITDRVNAQIALRDSTALHRAALQTTHDGFWLIDTEGAILQVNDAYCRLSGYRRDELLAMHTRDLVHDESAAEVERHIARVMRAGFDRFDSVHVRRSGTLVEVEVSAQYLPLQGGRLAIFVRDVTERRASERALRETNARLERVLHSITLLIGRMVEARDPYTVGHEQEVARISTLIAGRLGMSDHDIEGVALAALLHDVGKLAVPAEILSKPVRLSPLERKVIEKHSRAGYDILKDVEFEWPIADIVLQHHERMDGSGYPDGLSGDGILLPARIIAVADVLESMSSHRPYRPALGLEAALHEITGRAEWFDPNVVAACVSLHEEGALGLR